jgi:hypothetical protein
MTDDLNEKAVELGFQIKKLPKRGSGYVLVNKSHQDIDEFPLGSDFSASRADVENFLEDFASDIGAGRVKPSDEDDAEPEVETSAKLKKVRPPSPQRLAASLCGHADAAEIKAIAKELCHDSNGFAEPAPQTKQDVHDREALDNLLWVVTDPRASAAFYKQSKEIQAAHWRNLKIALEKDEKAKEAKLPKSTITIQDLEREERARRARKFLKLNWHRNVNPDGLHDRNEHDEEDDRDLKQFLEDEKRKRESFDKYLAPEKDAPDFAAPKAATGFEVATIKRRIARSELPKRRTLLEIATAIRIAIAKGDKAGAGKLLIEAKERTLDHGEFTQWAERETDLTSRTCRNYMAMAQNGK